MLGSWTSASPMPRRIAHPELRDRTIWEVFEAERPSFVPYRGHFDGFHAVPASVSKTCLVRFDNNKYSVSASAVGRPVEIRAYADRIVMRQDGRIVAEHRALLRARRDHLRSLALCAGSGAQARRAAQRGAVQGLGPASRLWSVFGANSPAPMTAIGRWSTSLPPC